MAVENMFFGRPDWSDFPNTLEANFERTGFPVENLLLMHPADRYETSTLTGIQIDIEHRDMAARDIEAVALLYTNATTSATITVTAGPTQGSSSAWNSGSIDLWATNDFDEAPTAHFFLKAPDSTSARWIRFAIEEPGTPDPDSILRIGRLMVFGKDPFSSINYAPGSRFGFNDRSRVGTTTRGHSTVTRGTVAKRTQVRFNSTSLTQIEELMAIAEERGGSRDVLAVRDPGATTRFAMGITPGLMGRQFDIEEAEFEFWRGNFVVEEFI